MQLPCSCLAGHRRAYHVPFSSPILCIVYSVSLVYACLFRPLLSLSRPQNVFAHHTHSPVISLRLPPCSRCLLCFGDRLYVQLYVTRISERFVQQVSATASMKARGISANPAQSSHNTSRGLAGGYGYGASPASVAVTVRSRDRDEKRV